MASHSLWDVQDLNRYWESHPPTHIMVAGYLGIKPKAKTSGSTATPEKLKAFAAAFGLGQKEG